MKLLMERLKEQQCDVEGALSRCRDNKEMYLELLRLFSEDTLIDRMAEAYRCRDVEKVFFYSCTLVGLYMNLGMLRLQEIDEQIVECIREKQEGCLEGMEEQMQSLFEQHHSLVEIIKEYHG